MHNQTDKNLQLKKNKTKQKKQQNKTILRKRNKTFKMKSC